MKKHNCIKWHEEGQGCAICSKSGLLKKDEVLQIQSWSNAHISELKREIEKLNEQLSNYKFITQFTPEQCRYLESNQERLDKEINNFKELITLLLPMAKGYAYKNQVGTNMEIIKHSEEAIKNYEYKEEK